jgi:pimeloyl-ACP methyl ester carboxylesterase
MNTDPSPSPTRLRRRLLSVLALLGLVLSLTSLAPLAAEAGGRHGPKPTVVLVHGAFADASGFADTAADLRRRGYPILAFANPLRGLHSDAEYLRQFLATVEGPVVLVGHSYGGAVITNAATGNPNIRALVYVAAFAPDERETVGAATELGGGTSLLLPNLIVRPYPSAPVIDFPNPGDRDADGYIDPAAFRQVFAADLPATEAAVMAAAQRPATLSSFGTPSGVPAWKTIRSWYLVARQDRAIPPEAERAMARRAGARTIEVNSSHAVMVSHPDEVTKLILRAIDATR